MIRIHQGQFVDEHGRTLMLRGVNLGGSSKVPTIPNGDTRFPESMQNPASASFIGRPFLLEEADEHFARLEKWGFNFLRLLTTWEAVEHAGPGIYDLAYLDYLAAVVAKAGEHGLTVFIDPHQDVWSRFTGGDGTPAWTFEAAGLEWPRFTETGAAVLQSASGDFYPPLIWGTNAIKLGAATMFTLFFAGNDFAPQLKVDGEPVQDYLQRHYIESMRQVALRLKGLSNVFGFDTLNEPNSGYIGWGDLAQPLGLASMGLNPSPYQSMLLGAGIPQELDFWQPALPKAKSLGKRTVNPDGQRAWKDGAACIWEQHGVWERDSDGAPRLLRPDYFAVLNGRKVDFNQDYLRPFVNRYALAIRSVMPEAAIFVESMPGLPAPRWGADDAQNIVHAPHWYDLFHIVTNDFIPGLAVDGRTGKLVLGSERIRKAFAAHLAAVKTEASENLGGAPTHIGEFGISFDIRKKQAYKTGRFHLQAQAMDRTFRALEDNLLSGTIWDYTADNTNDAKDKWNAQDYSIFSRDQQKNPADPHSGGRTLQAVVRPYARKVAGTPLRMSFDMKYKLFIFEFRHDPKIDAPTEIYLPDYQYPHGCTVFVSDGTYTLDPAAQTLVYHPDIKQEVHRIEVRPRPEPKLKVVTPGQYLWNSAVWSAGINWFLNLLAGWLLYHKTALMPLEGKTSVIGDATGMIFIIVFFSLLLGVPGTLTQIQKGQLLPHRKGPRFPAPLRWLLSNWLFQPLLLAFATVYLFIPLLTAALSALGVTGMTLWPFLAFKSLLGGLVAATIIPFGDWLVILSESGRSKE